MDQGTSNRVSDEPLAPAANERGPAPGAAIENRIGGRQGLAARQLGLYSSTMEQAIKEAIDRALGQS